MPNQSANRRIFCIGSLNVDLVLPVRRLPLPGETISGGDLHILPGGKGANQACAAGKLGGSVHMVGCVGCDVFAADLLKSLESAGVDTGYVTRASSATGSASIYVLPDGENAIVISPGANASLVPTLALKALENLTSKDIVLLQLEIPLETVEAVASSARARGCIVILDPAPARPLPDTLLRQVDYLTPNESEAALLKPASLLDKVQRGVILKLGAAGCRLMSPGGATDVPGFPVKALDTTAAGDVFNGALAARLAENVEPADAMRFANAAAAISVTRPGAQPSIPTRSEVDAFLSER